MTGSESPLKQYRRFESFREYEALLDGWVPRTVSVIRVFEHSLPAAWNNASRMALLREFLRANPVNRLFVLIHDASNIERSLPRLCDLQRDFGHAFRLRLTPRIAKHVYDPFAVFDASHYLHRFHYKHMRAAEGIHDADGAGELLERFSEMWEVSAPQSASTGGL
jgi:hypothetical protein